MYNCSIKDLYTQRVQRQERGLMKRAAQFDMESATANVEQLSIAWNAAINKAEKDLHDASALVLTVYNEYGAYLQSEHGPDYSMEIEWLQNLQQAIPFIYELALKAREIGQKRLDRINATQENLKETYNQGNMGNLLPGNSI